MNRDQIDNLAGAMRRAGEAVRQLRNHSLLYAEAKTSPQDIVTRGDRASEEILVAAIRRHFPEDGILGEEGASVGGARTWFLDPIDGTANYAGGSDYWGISAGTVKEFGMICLPDTQTPWFWVEEDGSAWMGGDGFADRLFSAREVRLRDALVDVGAWPGQESAFVAVRQEARMTGMINSVVWEAMLVAQGKLDAYVHTGASIFDISAAIPICRAAGCTVTGVSSDEPVEDLCNPEIGKRKFPIVIARSRQLSDELREAVGPLMR
ncbi:MAG TPA: inositol monophosphatase [Candidatus Paceibacterota bacterium]